jgi:ketosteroid isomerase-like protein
MAGIETLEGLLYRYAFASDACDTTAVAELFTEDGEFRLTSHDNEVERRAHGRPAITSYFDASHAARTDARRHLVTNVLVQESGDRATVMAYLALGVLEGGRLTIRATGTYRDECRRVEGAWLFARRHLVMDAAF